MIRIRSGADRAPENDLVQLSDIQAEAKAKVQQQIDSRKEQHRRWNEQWIDATWRPITPPLESPEEPPRWAPLIFPETDYPTPPPTLPSEGSRDRDDVEMTDQPVVEQEDTVADATIADDSGPNFILHIPGAWPEDDEPLYQVKRDAAPACRLRYGRGGRCHLETRKKRPIGLISSGVVSDSDSEEEVNDYFPVNAGKIFDYRVNMNVRARPEAMAGERRQHPSGDQSAMAVGASGGQTRGLPRQASAGSAA